LQNEVCNSKTCKGDEVCIADQDLIIAIDGSGSLQEAGFGILKSWVGKLLGKYKTVYYGQEKVRLGIVLFGNGVIMPDGKTVSPAINSQSLTSDAAAVVKVVNELPFKKGFTNMAQAFATAADMFDKGSRAGAQHSVMVVTDGKPSFSFMTSQLSQQLEDKGISRFFVVVSETDMSDNSMKGMKQWASQPWEANLLHVNGGLAMLEAAPNFWAEKALVMFCALSHSPSTEMFQEGLYGFQQIKDNGWCGNRASGELSTNVADAAACSKLAAKSGAHAFVMGKGIRKGYCYASDTKVTGAQYSLWRTTASRKNPQCAAPAANGCPEGYINNAGMIGGNFGGCTGTKAGGYCILGPEEAYRLCSASPNCGGVSFTTNQGWNNAYPSSGSLGNANEMSPNGEWRYCRKAWVASNIYDFYAIEPLGEHGLKIFPLYVLEPAIKGVSNSGGEHWSYRYGLGLEDCYQWAMAEGSGCAKDYFNYVNRGDKHCGCNRGLQNPASFSFRSDNLITDSYKILNVPEARVAEQDGAPEM